MILSMIYFKINTNKWIIRKKLAFSTRSKIVVKIIIIFVYYKILIGTRGIISSCCRLLHAGEVDGNAILIDPACCTCDTSRLTVRRTLCCRTCPTCALGPAWGPSRSRSVWGPASPAPLSPSRASFGTRPKEVRTSLQLNSPICLRGLRHLGPPTFLFIPLAP